MEVSEHRTTICSDIELLTWWFVRNHYENNNKQKNVPAALKYLIRNFSMKIFKPKFLSIKLDLDLVELLSKQFKFKNVTLLYKPSEHQYSASKFHELCDGQGATVTLIKSEFGNIFGGYTNISWSSIDLNIRNSGNTFLFLLSSQIEKQECPKIWKSTGELAVGHWKEFGPIFGWQEVRIVTNQCQVLPTHFVSGFDPALNINDFNEMCGADKSTNSDRKGYCFLVDYEVFKIS